MKFIIKRITILAIALFILAPTADAARRIPRLAPHINHWILFHIFNGPALFLQGHAWRPIHALVYGMDFRDFRMLGFTRYWVNLTPAPGRVQTIIYTRGNPVWITYNNPRGEQLRIDPPYDRAMTERFLRQIVGPTWDTPAHNEDLMRLLHRILPDMNIDNANAIARNWNTLEYEYLARDALEQATPEYVEGHMRRLMTELRILPAPIPAPVRRPLVIPGAGGSRF